MGSPTLTTKDHGDKNKLIIPLTKEHGSIPWYLTQTIRLTMHYTTVVLIALMLVLNFGKCQLEQFLTILLLLILLRKHKLLLKIHISRTRMEKEPCRKNSRKNWTL